MCPPLQNSYTIVGTLVFIQLFVSNYLINKIVRYFLWPKIMMKKLRC